MKVRDYSAIPIEHKYTILARLQIYPCAGMANYACGNVVVSEIGGRAADFQHETP
jgi:hypothetical protein